jgi:hypothetical protein
MSFCRAAAQFTFFVNGGWLERAKHRIIFLGMQADKEARHSKPATC